MYLESTPLVTIGIPCYNCGKFLQFAIKSVLAQTYTNFELIITDDGSTDNSIDIAKSFDDPRIILISDSENHGISYRLNQQIDMAKGEFFARFDADDIMLPDRIERQLSYLLNNPDIDAIGGEGITIDDDNNIIGRRGNMKKPLHLDKNIWITNEFLHPTVFGKTSYFKKYKYSDYLKGVEDRDLWFRSCVDSKLIMLPELYIFYRDPLKYKLHTYMFRRIQNRKMWRSAAVKKRYGKKICYKALITSYMRSLIIPIFVGMGFDKQLLKRRNSILSKEEFDRWYPYLNKITDK